MAAENNMIMSEDLSKVRIQDFNLQFTGSMQKIMAALGVTRKQAMASGTTLKVLKVKGTLGDGEVDEGEVIPLSHYETEYVDIGQVKLKKWRKGTTAEAIQEKGEDQAIGETTDKMLKDIQKSIRDKFFTVLETTDGTTSATGVGLQAALANGWGKLQVLWEDDAVDTVYFVNPLDVSDYLGTAQVTLQQAFGMSYIENFLGLGTVFLTSKVDQGYYYATAKENIIMFFIDMNSSDVARKFGLTADETGYIGIKEAPEDKTATIIDLIMSGVGFTPERIDGVVVGTITQVNP